MTTIREICDIGDVPEQVIEYFNKNKGQTPLCCFNIKKLNTQLLITCEWLKEWMTFEDFKTKCLECQKEISEKLKC